mgnify:CR=1 FL=1
MDFLQTVNFFDANSIISTLGLIGVLAIIFMETGLLIGLVFPGGEVVFFAGIKFLLWLAETVWDNAFLMLSLIILFIICGF